MKIDSVADAGAFGAAASHHTCLQNCAIFCELLRKKLLRAPPPSQGQISVRLPLIDLISAAGTNNTRVKLLVICSCFRRAFLVMPSGFEVFHF